MEKAGLFCMIRTFVCACVSIQDLRILYDTLWTYRTLHKTLNLKNIQIIQHNGKCRFIFFSG